MDHADESVTRLIRTDFSFDPIEIEGRTSRGEVGLVSILWYKCTEPCFHVRERIPQFLEYQPSAGQPTVIHPYRFFDVIIRGHNIRDTEPFENEDIKNPLLVDLLLNQTIVIQRSPLSEISIRELLRYGPDISIGTYIGISAANGQAPLMLITVPGGIVLVGAGIALSRVLQDGLAMRMKKWVSKRRQPKQEMTQDEERRADRIRREAAKGRLPD